VCRIKTSYLITVPRHEAWATSTSLFKPRLRSKNSSQRGMIGTSIPQVHSAAGLRAVLGSTAGWVRPRVAYYVADPWGVAGGVVPMSRRCRRCCSPASWDQLTASGALGYSWGWVAGPPPRVDPGRAGSPMWPGGEHRREGFLARFEAPTRAVRAVVAGWCRQASRSALGGTMARWSSRGMRSPGSDALGG
jgi:hypothetical protein